MLDHWRAARTSYIGSVFSQHKNPECTYHRASRRRPNISALYVDALQERLERAELLIRKFVSDADATASNVNTTNAPPETRADHARAGAQRRDLCSVSVPTRPAAGGPGDLLVTSSAHPDVDWDGYHSIHGPPSYLLRLKAHIQGPVDRNHSAPCIPDSRRRRGLKSHDLSPGSSDAIPALPAGRIARRLCSKALQHATCLLRIVHVPTFYTILDNLLGEPPEGRRTSGGPKLALVYSVMALGCLYNQAEDAEYSDAPGAAREEG